MNIAFFIATVAYNSQKEEMTLGLHVFIVAEQVWGMFGCEMLPSYLLHVILQVCCITQINVLSL